MTEETVFAAALEKSTPTERAAYLEDACAGDAALRKRVEALLASHEGAAGFLEKPAIERAVENVAGRASAVATQPDQPGTEDDFRPFLAPSDRKDSLGRLGHYEILGKIGRGGMGVVLRAFDDKLHRVVAIKAMAPQLAIGATARRRFVREAQAAAAVRNEHVIDIHAVEDAEGLPYLVMEYVSGVSLQQRLDRTGPLEVKEILRIGMQAATGLAAAHAQGLVHRDIKPANILLENGVERVKLTDFGLARAVDDASLTQSGVVAGTPQFMAPEQASGESVDHRADLFSLGSVLYAMCTGHAPFRASTTMAVLKRVCEDTPRPIREINPVVPDWLAAIISRLHAKDQADRLQSAAEVAELLSAHLAPLQQTAVLRIPGAPRSPSRRVHAGRRRAIAAALVLLLGGLTLTEATGFTNVAATVLRILTPDGTLVVQVEDPKVKVTIEGDGGLVITGTGPQEVRLHPGSYHVRADKDGKPLQTDVVTISRGDKQVVRVRLEAAGLARSTFRFKPPPPGPLDRLDPAKIPAWERFPWQPRELVAVLGEHRGRPWSCLRNVAVSPDGKLAASSGEDSLICIWDADTLRLRAILQGHTAPVWRVVFSPDSRRLLSGGDDHTLRLWDLETGREVRCFRGHAGPVKSVALSPDGRHALSGSHDRTVRLWEVETGKELGQFEGHTDWVATVDFSPDGSFALSGSQDRTMRLWDVKKRKEVRCLRGHTDGFRIVCFLPDGRRALSCSHDKTVRLWDLDTGEELRCFEGHTGQVYGVALAPDGRRAISVGYDQTIRFCDVESGRQLHVVPHTAVTSCVAFAPDGKRALVGDWHGAIHRCDVATGMVIALNHPVYNYRNSASWKLAFSPNGGRLLSCMAEDVARLWDLESGKQLHVFGMPNAIWGVAFSPNGRQTHCAGGEGMVLWEAESGKELRRIRVPHGIWDVVLSGDGRRMLAAQGDGTMRLWDTESGRELLRLGHAGSNAVASPPDQRRALSACWHNIVRLWDVDSGKELFRYEGHGSQVWGVAFAADGSHAASGDDDGFVRLWDMTETAPTVRVLPKWHSSWVRSVAFSPDGKVLASSGGDGRIILWDVAAGKKLHEWQLPGPIPAVGFAPDGRHLAFANLNATIYLLRLPVSSR
jgi:WD40 repeat protein